MFQSNQRFQAIEFVDRPVPEKRDIFALIFPKHSSQNKCIAWRPSRRDSYPQFPRTPLRLAPGTMTVSAPPFGVHTREKEEEEDDDDDDDDDDVTVVFLESRC